MFLEKIFGSGPQLTPQEMNGLVQKGVAGNKEVLPTEFKTKEGGPLYLEIVGNDISVEEAKNLIAMLYNYSNYKADVEALRGQPAEVVKQKLLELEHSLHGLAA